MVDRIISRLNRVFGKEPKEKRVITIWRNVPFETVVATDGYIYQLNVFLNSEGGYSRSFTRITGAGAIPSTIFATDGDYYQMHIQDNSDGTFSNFFTRVMGDGSPGPATMVASDNNRYALNIVDNGDGTYSDTYTRVVGTGTYGRTSVMISNLTFTVLADVSYSIDISTITVDELSAAINTQPGFAASVPDESFGNLLARGLLETNKPQDIAQDQNLYYPTSLLFQEMQTYGWALQDQSNRVKAAEKQLYMQTSEDDWLDFWGSQYFNTPRYNGESDTAYAQRITYQVIRATQNNVALSIIVQETLGVDCEILDAVPNIAMLATEDVPKAPGRFLLNMGIDNNLTSDQATALIGQVQNIVRRYKAGGTDFLMSALRQLVQTTETITTVEDVLATINITLTDTLVPGPIRASAGWRASCPGLKAGMNDAIKEQIYIKTIVAADSSIAATALYGG